MEYRQLGRSGLRVSQLCYGTMRIDDDNKDEVMRAMHTGIDLGINFIDTADCYGISEEVVGKSLDESGRRDDVVLASKATWYMGDGPNDYGASRYHLIEQCEESLRKLRTDHIDLYILHVVDPNTPLREILRTMDDLVRQGKVRYIGTSKWPASLITEAIMLSEKEGLERFVSEQPPYNILDRRVEDELSWTAQRHGVALTPFRPLGKGILSGKYKKGEVAAKGSYMEGVTPGEDDIFTEEAIDAVDALKPLAEKKGITPAELSLAWIMQQPGITSPIVGARTEEYVRSAVKACEVELTEDDLTAIDGVVPPGGYVSNFYDSAVYRPIRFDYSSEARRVPGTGAFIPDNRTGSSEEAGAL
jgi:aryl-alcohol dehydrogenase-like predicted oxidoreductase